MGIENQAHRCSAAPLSAPLSVTPSNGQAKKGRGRREAEARAPGTRPKG